MTAFDEIRRAVRSDAEEIAGFDHAASESSARREFIGRSIDADICFVAVRDGRVVAYGVLEDAFFGYNLVAMLYVAERSRRRGVGAALLRHMERESRTPKLFVTTNASNAPMRSLLARLGFEPSGVIENLDEGDAELVFFKPVSR